MARRRPPIRAYAVLAVAGAVVLGPTTAQAAAPVPTAPAEGSRVDALRPAFTWTAATRALLRPPIARYEVVVLGPPDRVVATVPVGTLTATSTADLPDESTVTWFVRAIDNGGAAQTSRRAIFSIASRPSPPTVIGGPAGPTRVAGPTFSWAGDRTDSHWVVVPSGGGAALQEGIAPSAGGSAALAPLADGAYVFRVAQRNSAGLEGDPATRSFTIDTAAPAALTISARQPVASTTTTPSFGWQAPEPGATVTWRVLDAGGATVQGPSQALDGVTTGALAPGTYRFEAHQIDGAGNEGPWTGSAFTVTGAATAGTGAFTLPARNDRLLLPRKGTRLLKVRPTLRWARGPARTTVYNLQIFRVVGPGPQLRKIYSVFPRKRVLKMPKVARLTPGACYVWRVWPFRNGSFTKAPLGVSNFCVKRRSPVVAPR